MEMMKQGAMMTVLSSLLSALALPATLLTLTDIIDSKWSIAVHRSDKARKLLTEVLVKECKASHLGHKLLFNVCELFGLKAIMKIELFFMEHPFAILDENWEAARRVKYLILLSQGLAGIQPVDVPGIENVDVT
ncbi:transmembrane and coiled-coil domain-containing protein 4-like protein [Tanacetum coccineum]